MNGRETCKTFWSILSLVLSSGELLSYRRPATPTKRPRRKVKFLIFFSLPSRNYLSTTLFIYFFLVLSFGVRFPRQYLSRFPLLFTNRWHSRVRDSAIWTCRTLKNNGDLCRATTINIFRYIRIECAEEKTYNFEIVRNASRISIII